jgi:glycerol-3-phosphate acyltransferase PlsY
MLAAAWVLRGVPDEPRKFFLWLLVGLAAILGHMFSLFLRFKGGKGVATSSGVILGLFPYFTIPGLIGLALWAAVFKTTRYVSLASMAAAVAFPVLYVTTGLLRGWPVFAGQWPLLAFSVLVAAMIVYKHRSNIARLRAGTESRFDRSAAPANPS